MRRTLLIIALAGLATACGADCLVYPNQNCPKEYPYINKWHPGYCYPTPQPPETQP